MKTKSFKKEICLLLLLISGILIILSLISYSPLDPSLFSVSEAIKPKNYIGVFGSNFSDLLFQVFGYGAWIIAVFPFYLFVYYLFSEKFENKLSKIVLGSVFFTLLLSPLFYFTLSSVGLAFNPGGFLGKLVGDIFEEIFGLTGSYILLIGLILISFIYSTGISIFSFVGKLFVFIKSFFVFDSDEIERTDAFVDEDEVSVKDDSIIKDDESGELTESSITFHPGIQEIDKENEQYKDASGFDFSGEKDISDDRPFTFGEEAAQINNDTSVERTIEPVTDIDTIGKEEIDNDSIDSNNESQITIDDSLSENKDFVELPTLDVNDIDLPKEESVEKSDSQDEEEGEEIKIVEVKQTNDKPVKRKKIKRKQHNYELPSINFLDEPESMALMDSSEELRKKAVRLQEKLKEFKIGGKVTGIRPGPIITLYEFELSPGIKSAKILGLVDDLSLALKVPKIRAAVMSERGAVGIEVPNQHRRTVKIKEIIEDDVYNSKKHKLPLVLGLDISGRPVVEDIAKMPHLLVAGVTGSGKSVGINSILLGLLYSHTPKTLKLVLIDPKMVELSVYSDIPHLLVPVISDSERAVGILKGLVSDMDKRYSFLQLLKVRNIDQYNIKIKELADENGEVWVFPDNLFIPSDLEKNEEGKIKLEYMPYIVVIVDEYADLMSSSGKKVEEYVARIAQKARAAGIHMILATQRPEAKVVTGIIKSNHPARISFFVRSKLDSRVILDDSSAAQLLGQGDMLFLHPGKKDLIRIQGPFVTLDEVNEVIRFWKSQGSPDYRMDLIVTENNGDNGDFDMEVDDEDKDDIYYKSLDVALRDGFISASKLQRELKIGYNRASRYVDIMEREGIVGKSDGSKPRKVLINKEEI